MVAYLVGEISALAKERRVTPFEAMWQYAESPLPERQETPLMLA